MFKELSFSYTRVRTSLVGSYSLHLFLIAFLLFYSHISKFIVPHLVETRRHAYGVTPLYWLGDTRGNESRLHTRKPVVLSRFAPKGKNTVFQVGRPLLRKSVHQRVLASAAESPGNPSLHGSDDIRPALPIATVDPVITHNDLAGGVKGDVIVEISIDSNGNIVAKRVEHGLGPAIDRKVLAAVEGWRFRPAMEDGRPIPSKQDIHYHFPVGDVDPTKLLETHPHPAAVLTQSPCPVLLVSGTANTNHLSITFMNVGKLPIRQLEFNCGSRNVVHNTADLSLCRENNALFYSGQEYTLEYATRDRSHSIQISVNSVTLSDGHVWKPAGGQSCAALTIRR